MMSHYDCRDCGATEGIAYGICESCTPAEVFEAKHRYRNACAIARQEFDDSLNDLRLAYIQEKTADLEKTYEELYERHKPKK